MPNAALSLMHQRMGSRKNLRCFSNVALRHRAIAPSRSEDSEAKMNPQSAGNIWKIWIVVVNGC